MNLNFGVLNTMICQGYKELGYSSQMLATSTIAITKGIVLPEGNYKGSSAAFTISSTDSSTNIPAYIAINNGNWATASIWSGGSVPDSSSSVAIPNGLTVTVAAALTRGKPSTTTVNGTLVLSSTLTSNGTVNINSGTIQVNISPALPVKALQARILCMTVLSGLFLTTHPRQLFQMRVFIGAEHIQPMNLPPRRHET
ncbi:MAG: hypothetical protein PW786_05160 [Arachidicoccus sp.]|nr:hypothetical protein [Arachidicoccus sp.]